MNKGAEPLAHVGRQLLPVHIPDIAKRPAAIHAPNEGGEREEDRQEDAEAEDRAPAPAVKECARMLHSCRLALVIAIATYATLKRIA
jgi:hypothetical protein